MDSSYDDDTVFRVNYYKYDWDRKTFYEDGQDSFLLDKTSGKVALNHSFQYGSLYKIKLISPTFSPKKKFGSEDTRQLGVAVYRMSLQA